MIRYDVRCTVDHDSEFSASNMKNAWDEIDAFRCEHDSVETPGAPCGEHVRVVVLPTKSPKGIGVLYNAHGFYGSIPTEMAHNTGAV